MNLLQAQEGEQLVTNAIAYMSEYDKPSLLEMLKRSGSLVTEMSTQQEMLDAAFKALKDSDRFRKDLAQYIKSVTSESNFSNYVDDDMFANGVGDTPSRGGTSTKKKSYNPQTGEGGTAVGNLLRGVFSPENISALTQVGIGYASTRLQNAANKQGNQQAIDYKNAEAQAAIAEAQRLQMQLAAGTAVGGGAGSKKWVKPVLIVTGVLAVGAVLFFALRKKQ